MRLREKQAMSSLTTPIDGQNHDVNRGMGIEPEQMLEEKRIATEFGIEDAEMESAFRGHQHDGDGDNRRAQKLNDAGGIHAPR
jgi:hypothetical protein